VNTPLDTMREHGKSFALASAWLPPPQREATAVLYAWCRHADDAVDEPADGAPEPLEAIRALQTELAPGSATSSASLTGAFLGVARRYGIPLEYPAELLRGFEMDARGARYVSKVALLRYCFRVAGTVGLMLSHVFALRDERARSRAAHLGIAMQLTNIARDVGEDWARGRLYLPDELLASAGGLDPRAVEPGTALTPKLRCGLAQATLALLDEADRWYRSADEGLYAFPLRASIATTAARRLYARIGDYVRRQGADPLAGRAYVPLLEKLWVFLGAATSCLGHRRQRAPAPMLQPQSPLRFPDDIMVV
jgi:phytoene synthase